MKDYFSTSLGIIESMSFEAKELLRGILLILF